MRRFTLVVANVVLALLANVVMAVSANAQQAQRPLVPTSPESMPIVPIMEGWYANGDGTITISFGYSNRNKVVINIPLGKNNRLEPAQPGVLIPEYFSPGRHAGVFTITIEEDETVWWHLKRENTQEFKVPGDNFSTGYELDRKPRPQGSVPPLIGFKDEAQGTGPEGSLATQIKTIAVGAPLTLEVHSEDPSVRDPSNPLFAKPLDTRVVWYEHQGPANVVFTEHPSTPFKVSEVGFQVRTTVEGPSRVEIPGGKGLARVIATFSEPGEYLIRARADNWKASDSDGLDQCCWSNAYQRVTVTP